MFIILCTGIKPHSLLQFIYYGFLLVESSNNHHFVVWFIHFLTFCLSASFRQTFFFPLLERIECNHSLRKGLLNHFSLAMFNCHVFFRSFFTVCALFFVILVIWSEGLFIPFHEHWHEYLYGYKNKLLAKHKHRKFSLLSPSRSRN